MSDMPQTKALFSEWDIRRIPRSHCKDDGECEGHCMYSDCTVLLAFGAAVLVVIGLLRLIPECISLLALEDGSIETCL